MIYYEQNKTVTSYSFGLGKSSLDHRRREEFPAIFYMIGLSKMKELSVFIDESGDFANYQIVPHTT